MLTKEMKEVLLNGSVSSEVLTIHLPKSFTKVEGFKVDFLLNLKCKLVDSKNSE